MNTVAGLLEDPNRIVLIRRTLLAGQVGYRVVVNSLCCGKVIAETEAATLAAAVEKAAAKLEDYKANVQ